MDSFTADRQAVKETWFHIIYRQEAGSHEIWYSEERGKFTTLPNQSGDMPEGTLREILKQTDISVDEFLGVKK